MPFAIDPAIGYKLIELRRVVASAFSAGNWGELGLLTGCSDIIDDHERLLRSLSWGDDDYDGNVLAVLKMMFERHPANLEMVEGYVAKAFPETGVISEYISAKLRERRITFAPHVFEVPDAKVEPELVAVMMPFDKAFDPVYQAIKDACAHNLMPPCLRVDDLWEASTIVQDIFTLIFTSSVVVVDFTGKNPNVMYETGIAHTLGKHVVPISQSEGDVPFDLRHHRYLKYLANREGLAALTEKLAKKLEQFCGSALAVARPSAPPLSAVQADDDSPF